MQRPARLLAVLAVLVGLLAMHGVTVEHRAMGGADNGGSAMAATSVGSAQTAPALTAVALRAVTEVERPSQPVMTSMAALCLAIRNSDLTPGLRGYATQTARRMTHPSGLDHRPARAGAAPRRPDLVAGLCVSRT